LYSNAEKINGLKRIFPERLFFVGRKVQITITISMGQRTKSKLKKENAPVVFDAAT